MNEDPQQRLEMRWLPVLDAAGHTQMQASWIVVPTPAEAVVSHAA